MTKISETEWAQIFHYHMIEFPLIRSLISDMARPPSLLLFVHSVDQTP